ncbi:Na+/H+ antiporter NhaA [Sphingobium sp. 3R8]|uniref:Na(+)/H(+) antiporter NhaA n=1 Tax=Sphingomonas bisphenolicum TaxID=296544 RepID=A0ABM7G5W3_9SPHN|nr:MULTISPECIES: Na+/H+ antiporter NhaA [Sphingomonadaceae]MBA4090494.1 Na+/H+ antiporter NhaA [Sphingobium sp.]MBZ9647911.1 Na+/H+ antiporter NhaA [Sphingobium sp. 3R8]BBF71208.1 Na(+)/H(+) antiporter NhaA [Sphingomonas bisphenolicum]
MNRPPRSALRDFLTGETGGAILLMIAAGAAMILANLPGATGHLYHDMLHAPLGPTLSSRIGPMTLHLWINDGLMAIFFLVVGLEIKREFLDGGLSTWDRRRLPILAAVAGMAAPALVYLLVTAGRPALGNGWAIPAATDIAFAIGVLALLGRRAPASLKLFLTAVAIVDDMGAVAIIALFYSHGLDLAALAGAAGVLALMYGLNRAGVKALAPYLLGFALLWFLMLLSGVHATVAGVLAAMTVPVRCTPGAPDAADSPLHRLEHAIHPWSAYLIVPLFGFANAGLSLGGEALAMLFAPLSLGVAFGLFLGKQLGIFGAVWAAVRLGFAERPAGASWSQVYGMAMLCGIGFTMSLFIGALAFPGQPLLVEEAKGGILLGSLLSALSGYAVLRWIARPAASAAR